MAPIYSGGVDVAPENEDISSLHSSLGSTIAAAAEGFVEGPAGQLNRLAEMQAANGIMPPIGDGVTPQDLTFPVPKIPREQAIAKVKAAGLDKQITVPDNPQVSSDAIELMIKHAQEDNARAATIADGPRGFTAGALDMGTSFLVGAADPLNIAASFIPVVGEARYAKLMSSAGTSILGRAAVRAGTGIVGGAAFSTAFLPLDWAAATSDGRDYTLSQALRSVIAGAGQFGVLHVGGGWMSDFWRSFGPSSARRPLYPFAPGEPFERRAGQPAIQPATEPATGEPAAGPAATAPGAPGTEAGAAAPQTAGTATGAVPAEPSRPQREGAAPAPTGAGRTLEQVLANPRVGEAFANLKIDSTKRVPYGAGADVEDPNLVHVAEHLPTRDVINGTEYDPRVPVALHELDERDGMEHEGLAYPVAHRTRGETAEKAWVDQHLGPGAWPIYTRRWDGWLAHIEPEKIENVPEGLYTKPYPFKERERIERLQRHEAAAAGERATIHREVSTAVQRAGRPKGEADAAGQMFAARYATRASRFGYRNGSALDLFRAEHLGIRRGEPNFISSGRAFDQQHGSAALLPAAHYGELPAGTRLYHGSLTLTRPFDPCGIL